MTFVRWRKDFPSYLKAELNSRLRSLVFCLGDISKIKEKSNLFREEKTKGKVSQLWKDVKKYESCLLLSNYVPSVKGKKCGNLGRTNVS